MRPVCIVVSALAFKAVPRGFEYITFSRPELTPTLRVFGRLCIHPTLMVDSAPGLISYGI